MTGLRITPRPAIAEERTPRGRITRHGHDAVVTVCATPASRWTCTDPDQLDQAAEDLRQAADWLRGEQARTNTTPGGHP